MATIKQEITQKYSDNGSSLKDIHYDMINRFFQWVKKHNLKIFLAWGGFLGYVRENRLIEWDHDIDVAMLESYFDELTQEVLDDLDNFGLERYHKNNNKYHYKEDKFNGEYFRIYNKNKLTKFELIELFPLQIDHSKDECYYKFWFTKRYAPIQLYSNLQWVNFKGINIQIPYDIESALIHQYNDKWRTPKMNKKYISINHEYQRLIDIRLKEMKLELHNIDEYF